MTTADRQPARRSAWGACRAGPAPSTSSRPPLGTRAPSADPPGCSFRCPCCRSGRCARRGGSPDPVPAAPRAARGHSESERPAEQALLQGQMFSNGLLLGQGLLQQLDHRSRAGSPAVQIGPAGRSAGERAAAAGRPGPGHRAG